MEPKSALLCSQQPVTCSYPMSDEALTVFGVNKYFGLILKGTTVGKILYGFCLIVGLHCCVNTSIISVRTIIVVIVCIFDVIVCNLL